MLDPRVDTHTPFYYTFALYMICTLSFITDYKLHASQSQSALLSILQHVKGIQRTEITVLSNIGAWNINFINYFQMKRKFIFCQSVSCSWPMACVMVDIYSNNSHSTKHVLLTDIKLRPPLSQTCHNSCLPLNTLVLWILLQDVDVPQGWHGTSPL